MVSLPLEFEELADWLWCMRTPIAACFAIRDRDGVVMVDANVAGQEDAIIGALADRLGVSKDALPLRQILMTHAHADHYGSARELARRTGAELFGSAEEADAFAGRRPLPEPQLHGAERQLFERIMPNVPPAPPVELDRKLRPGDTLDWEIGAEVVAAEGHTSGQLAVWIPGHRTLIAGDAVATRGDGRPITGVFNVDRDQASLTATRLLDTLAPSLVCVAHGAPIRGDVRRQFDASEGVRSGSQ